MLSFILLAASLARFSVAQSSNITAIEAHFTGAHIVPDLFASFDPSATLTLNFDGVGDITPGQALTEDQVTTAPTVTVTADNSSISLDGNFTIMMIDADIVGTSDATGNVTRHWLLNGVTISDRVVDNSTATAITAYGGPAPASGSGPHRYVVILYAQPDTFTGVSDLQAGAGISTFSLSSYVQDSGLGSLIGANYMTVEEGTATVSIEATSTVVSSTLASSAATKSATASSSVTSSGEAASETTGNGAVFIKADVAVLGFAAVLALALA